MRWPRIGRLRTRLVVSLALSVVAAQGIGYWLVDAASARNARAQLEQELVAGERVLARLLEHDRRQLAQAATLLATDPGLREAIAARDAGTVNAVLDTHGGRIDAATVQLVSLDGKVVAQAIRAGARRTSPDDDDRPPDFGFPDLLETARLKGGASRIVSPGDVPMQVVVVPVRAPDLIAWLAVGFEIDDRLARDLHGLTGLDVSFLRGAAADRSIVASTLEGQPRRALRGLALAGYRLPGAAPVELGGVRFGGRVVDLSPGSQPPMHAVLQRPVDDKLAAFAWLRQRLVALALCSLLVAILLGGLLARGITRPLARLHQGARRVGEGDYGEPVAVGGCDELGALAHRFNGMREEIAAREQDILRLAYQDALTGLPNRARFNEELDAAIRGPHGSGTALALLVLGLDRFKPINDALGHRAGDHVLCQVALRLRQLAPPSAILARLGGDEFALLLRPLGDAVEGIEGIGGSGGSTDPERMAQMLLEMMNYPVMLDDQPLDVGGSIGIARYPVDGADAGTLIRQAAMAMAAAKRGERGYAFSDPRFGVAQQDHLSLLGELRRAVAADDLRVYYQPKIELASGVTRGVEALVRWQHRSRGLLAPGAFMPHAERTGFVRQVTRWMLEQAIGQCGRWHADGMPLEVSINISARDLADGRLPALLGQLLARHAVPPGLVCLELTESSFIEDPERALAILREIDALGVRLSIDDFGTGFSSLSYLNRLPVDELKIDREFIKGMLEDPDDFAIVRSTIELAHRLGLRVVAEGVETEQAMNALAGLGCDLVQGLFASKPVPADDLRRWLAESPWGVVSRDAAPVAS